MVKILVFGVASALDEVSVTGFEWLYVRFLLGGFVVPISSMHGMSTYIWLEFMVNVGKNTIHGASRNWGDEPRNSLHHDPSRGHVSWGEGVACIMINKVLKSL